jgi:hypothetical protein
VISRQRISGGEISFHFQGSTGMRWVGLALLTLAAALGARFLLVRRSGTSLGSVSDRWIAQHRADSP